MLRTKASTYAVLVVAEIANRDPSNTIGAQAGEVARLLDLPAAYVAKVLTQLARAGILRSGRGPRGGFRLNRSPDSIALLEVIEAVDGTITAKTDILRKDGETASVLRALDTVFSGIISDARSALRDTTIADLMPTATPAASLVKTP